MTATATGISILAGAVRDPRSDLVADYNAAVVAWEAEGGGYEAFEAAAFAINSSAAAGGGPAVAMVPDYTLQVLSDENVDGDLTEATLALAYAAPAGWLGSGSFAFVHPWRVTVLVRAADGTPPLEIPLDLTEQASTPVMELGSCGPNSTTCVGSPVPVCSTDPLCPELCATHRGVFENATQLYGCAGPGVRVIVQKGGGIFSLGGVG